MTDNPTHAGGAAAAPQSGDMSTRTSTMTNESPTSVTEARSERTVVGTPAGAGSAAGSSEVTRTTTFSGDPAYRGVQMVWALLGATELVIGLRVMFRALAATDTGFVSFIYGLGGALTAPFRGIANWTSGTTVVEVGSLIAMAVYVLVAFVMVKLVHIAAAPRRPGASGA